MAEHEEILEYFEVEELEQRFELGWIKGGDVGVEYEPSNGDLQLTGRVRF